MSLAARLAPLRVLAVRAAVGYPMLRALLFVAAALLSAFTGDPDLSRLGNPVGVVIIATAVGAVDIRRRGESILWADLGYPRPVLYSPFAVMAISGEVVLALLL